MLSEKIINQMIPLAKQQAEQGVKLVAATDSPLDYLVKHSSLGGMVTGDGQIPDINVVSAWLSSRTEAGEHSEIFDTIRDKVVDDVTRLIGMTRRVVMPDIKDIHAKVKAQIDARLATIQEPFVIVQIEAADIFNNPMVMEQVQRYKNADYADLNRMDLPPLTEEQISAALSTTNADFNAQLNQMASPGCVSAAADVWSGALRFNEIEPSSMYVLFLICKSLYESPAEGLGMSLINYQTTLTNVMEQAGLAIYNYIERLGRQTRLRSLYATGNFVYSTTGPQEIYVNGNVYRSMLKEGLKPETLFANEMLDRRYVSEDLLNAEVVDKLESVYKQNTSIVHRQRLMNEVSTSINAIARVFVDEIRQRQDLVVQPEILAARLKTILDNINEDKLRCLEHCIRDMVCDVFYAHTDCKRFIQIFDRLQCDENTDHRHSALVATMEYTGMWLASMFVPTKDRL